MGAAGRLRGAVALVTGGRDVTWGGTILSPSICVHCTGVTRDKFLLRLALAPFQEVLQVQTSGALSLVAQAVARALVAAGARGGSIVLLGWGVGNLGQANYAACKAGVEGLARSSAKELARFGIRCNVVLPGFIATPMTAKVPPKVLEKVSGCPPLGTLMSVPVPPDVADVCAFVASDDSASCTGASVEVTGLGSCPHGPVTPMSLFTPVSLHPPCPHPFMPHAPGCHSPMSPFPL
ncbi:(3R)-3-hydroxyacyl-CoA dehydrogenase [Anas platyrhynchos]